MPCTTKYTLSALYHWIQVNLPTTKFSASKFFYAHCRKIQNGWRSQKHNWSNYFPSTLRNNMNWIFDLAACHDKGEMKIHFYSLIFWFEEMQIILWGKKQIYPFQHQVHSASHQILIHFMVRNISPQVESGSPQAKNVSSQQKVYFTSTKPFYWGEVFSE